MDFIVIRYLLLILESLGDRRTNFIPSIVLESIYIYKLLMFTYGYFHTSGWYFGVIFEISKTLLIQLANQFA